ncbi:unnamed protein product [Knipowitschia caucasica]|uniref:PDZ domain-containing protein n=1 Tax=Knipowitschia caucasica TaxID=637954 RepID=A0AAV2KXB9_KNICA
MRSSINGALVIDTVTAASTSCSSDEDLPDFSSQSDLESVACDPSDAPADGGVASPFTGPQETQVLSLAQRVQLNRIILQQLLKSPPAENTETNSGSDLDESDSEDHQNGNTNGELTSASPLPHPLSRACASVKPFVSARLPRQQQCADGARMKRRPGPLRADHNLLAPDPRDLPGVRHCAASHVNSLPGHHHNAPHTQAGNWSARRRPESSPNRRLRFEDETETEAESRYLERQKRRAGQQVQDILVSKPDVSHYVSGRHKFKGESQHKSQQGVKLQLHPTLPVYSHGQMLYPIPPARPVISLHTEPIKETYIGVVMFSDSDGGETEEKVYYRRALSRRKTSHIKQNGLHKQATPQPDLPVNPYAPANVKVHSYSIFSPPPALVSVTPHNGKPNDTQTDKKHKKSKAKAQKCQIDDLTDHDEQRVSEVEAPDSESSKLKTPSASTGGHNILASSKSNGSKSGKEPMRAEHRSPLEPVEGSRLSLRRLFSSVRLGRSRSSSLDRTSSHTLPGDQHQSHSLKKTPSVQSLTMGSSFLSLRKSASVQNFMSEHKKDRSEHYKPGTQSALQRCLSVEDVSCPSSLRSVGRILQVYTDGTLLLELCRPKSQTYGFIISRGKGRTDSGVYVEEMVDSSTEKLYAGLLAIGDEILEVNEEKVACLSLDQVTLLLSHSSTVRVRVLRQRKPPSR